VEIASLPGRWIDTVATSAASAKLGAHVFSFPKAAYTPPVVGVRRPLASRRDVVKPEAAN